MAQRQISVLPLTVSEPGAVEFSTAGLTEVHTWRDLSGQVCARGYVGECGRWIRWPGVVSYRFDEHGRIDAFPDPGVDPAYAVDLCRRSVEPIVLQALGYEALHASAIRVGHGIVAFCGEREAGKSTIAYSLARRGYRQQSDDAVVMRIHEQAVDVLDLPFGVRLRPEAAAFYGFDTQRPAPLHDVVPLQKRAAGAIATVPLGVVFVLNRKPDGPPVVTRLSPTEAFTATLAQAHCFEPDNAAARRRLLQNYLAMAAAVPMFQLTFSAGLDRLGLVLDCIERAAAEVVAA